MSLPAGSTPSAPPLPPGVAQVAGGSDSPPPSPPPAPAGAAAPVSAQSSTVSAKFRKALEPESEEIDPRLEQFLQKAAPILAVERGINAKSRVLLGAVARDLGLSDAELEDGIKALQHGRKDSGRDGADPAVDAFYRYLHARLGKFKGILTLDLQNKAVDMAREKFQVPEEAARQAISDVAAELRVRRITVADAERHITSLIEQKLGGSAWLDDETMDRLRAVGREWGLNTLEVDSVIRRHMTVNRQSQKKEHHFITASLAVAGLVVLALVGFFVWSFVIRPLVQGDGATVAAADGDADAEPATDADATPSGNVRPKYVPPPAWWAERLTRLQFNARQEIPGYPAIFDGLASSDVEKRGEAYSQLVASSGPVLAAEGAPSADLLQEIVVLCYELEPDDAAAAKLSEALLSLTALDGKTLPAAAVVFQQARWAVETAARAMTSKTIGEERADQLAADLSRAIGTSIDRTAARAEVVQRCLPALASLVYQALTAAGPADPLKALEFQQAVDRDVIVDDAFPEDLLARLQTDFLVATLPAAGERWRDFEILVRESGYFRGPLDKLKLLEVYERTDNATLRSFLGDQLLREARATAESTEVADVAAAVRRSLGVAPTAAAVTQDRWKRLLELTDVALARSPVPPSDQRRVLEETVELAWLASLASALAQQEAGFPLFDELLASGVPPLAPKPAEEGADAGDTRPTAMPTGPRPLNEAVRAKLDGFFANLAKYDEHKEIERQTFLRGLANDADRLPNISPSQAESLARYLLAAKTEKEQAGIVGSIEAVTRWPHARLALADLIEKSPLPDAQAAEVVAKALRREFAPEGANWRASARQQLLRDVLVDLQAVRGARSEAASEPVLDLAAEALRGLYRERARQLRVDPGVSNGAASPAAVLALLVAQTQAQASAGGGDLSWLAPRLEVIDYLATHDLQRTVALQRVWLKLLALELRKLGSVQAGQADALVRQLEQRDVLASHLLGQLRDGEATTLRIWLLYAPKGS